MDSAFGAKIIREIVGRAVKTTHQLVLTDEYVAEAQRLRIAQNKTLKFLYQTWWSWWLPRVGMVGLIIYLLLNHFESSVVAMTGAFLAIHFFAEWFGRRNLAKARKKIRFKGSTTTVSMDENGVDVVGEAGTTHGKWPGILPPAIYPNGVLIRFNRIAMIWLPDQALIEGSAADVRRLLDENVEESSTDTT
jgi:hypothetical protein